MDSHLSYLTVNNLRIRNLLAVGSRRGSSHGAQAFQIIVRWDKRRQSHKP